MDFFWPVWKHDAARALVCCILCSFHLVALVETNAEETQESTMSLLEAVSIVKRNPGILGK